jgi:hypothetical protein
VLKYTDQRTSGLGSLPCSAWRCATTHQRKTKIPMMINQGNAMRVSNSRKTWLLHWTPSEVHKTDNTSKLQEVRSSGMWLTGSWRRQSSGVAILSGIGWESVRHPKREEVDKEAPERLEHIFGHVRSVHAAVLVALQSLHSMLPNVHHLVHYSRRPSGQPPRCNTTAR